MAPLTRSKVKMAVKSSPPRRLLRSSERRRRGDEVPVEPSSSSSSSITDLTVMFNRFNTQYFESSIRAYQIEWSNSMTSKSAMTDLERLIIRVSRPVHRHLSHRELEETVLHEMIHAYCHVHDLPTGEDTHGGHFLKIMRRLNRTAGYCITVDHPAADELKRAYKWVCKVCRQKRTLSRNVVPPHRNFVHACNTGSKAFKDHVLGDWERAEPASSSD